MSVVTILDTDVINLTLDKEKKIFNVNLLDDTPYEEKGFLEGLEYFKTTWTYINTESNKYHLLINLGIGKKENELPLHAYIKLIKVITDLNSIFVNCCHSSCILSEGSEKWQSAYNLITKLWNPPDRRPLLFTQNQDEVNKFFQSNKIARPQTLA